MTQTIVDAWAAVPALAIIRHPVAGDTAGVLDRLARGGLRAAEVTTSTPGWLDLIAGAPAELAVGAGTVLSLGQVRDASAAGATFIVSPGFDPEIVRAALSLGLEPLPGVLTPTEITTALGFGVRYLKLFPAEPLGIAYLRSLRGPFPEVAFVPTGGVRVETAADWIRAGAVAVALGSDLTGTLAPGSLSGFDEVERRTVDLVASLGRSAVTPAALAGEVL